MKSRYYNAWFCIKCREELSLHEVKYSSGRCPLCGFKSPTACTCVTTFEKAYQRVKVPSKKWYKFFQWKKVFKEDSK